MIFQWRRVTSLICLASAFATNAAGDGSSLGLSATGRIRVAPHISIGGGLPGREIVLPLHSSDPIHPQDVRSSKAVLRFEGMAFPSHFTTSPPAACTKGGELISSENITTVLDGRIRHRDELIAIQDERPHSISVRISSDSFAMDESPIICRDSGGLTITY